MFSSNQSFIKTNNSNFENEYNKLKESIKALDKATNNYFSSKIKDEFSKIIYYNDINNGLVYFDKNNKLLGLELLNKQYDLAKYISRNTLNIDKANIISKEKNYNITNTNNYDFRYKSYLLPFYSDIVNTNNNSNLKLEGFNTVNDNICLFYLVRPVKNIDFNDSINFIIERQNIDESLKIDKEKRYNINLKIVKSNKYNNFKIKKITQSNISVKLLDINKSKTTLDEYKINDCFIIEDGK